MLFRSRALEDTGADHPARGLLEAGAFRAQRVALQQTYMERLHREANMPVLTLPYYFVERVTFPVIRDIAKRLDAQITDSASAAQ